MGLANMGFVGQIGKSAADWESACRPLKRPCESGGGGRGGRKATAGSESPHLTPSSLSVGRTPWSARVLDPLLAPPDQPHVTRERLPGGPRTGVADRGVRPTICAESTVLGKVSGIGLPTCPTNAVHMLFPNPFKHPHVARAAQFRRPLQRSATTMELAGFLASYFTETAPSMVRLVGIRSCSEDTSWQAVYSTPRTR
jgi:hypothetical protein